MVFCTVICTQLGAGVGLGVSSLFGNGGFADQVSFGLVFTVIFSTVGFMLGAYSDFLLVQHGYNVLFK